MFSRQILAKIKEMYSFSCSQLRIRIMVKKYVKLILLSMVINVNKYLDCASMESVDDKC